MQKELLTIIGLKIMVPRCFVLRCRGEKKEAKKAQQKVVMRLGNGLLMCDDCFSLLLLLELILRCISAIFLDSSWGLFMDLVCARHRRRPFADDRYTKLPNRPADHIAGNFFNNFPFIY